MNRLEAKPAEPVAIAELVRLGFAALAGVGWLVVPDTTVNLIGTAVAAIVSIVATVLARRKVTPIAPGSDGVPDITSLPPDLHNHPEV